MVAAMPLSTESLENKKTVTTNDLRNLALFLAGGLALLLVASQMVDSGSASATALEDTPEKRFAAPTLVASPSATATEDVAYSSDGSWVDGDGAITFTFANCASWMTCADNSDGGAGTLSTYTISGTPDDSEVAATTITVTATQGTDSVSQQVTITVSQINDEPTLTATGATGTFTEGGSNLALFSSADAGDSDSAATQTFEEITVTITNVADEEEFLVIDGSDCDITAAATCVANTATNSGAAVVTLNSGTATVTWTADDGNELSEAEMEALVNGLAYKNTDDAPTVSNNRVVTITSMKDSGGTTGAGDDTVSLSIAATVTLQNTNDAPVIADSDDTGAVTEAASGTTDTATDTMTVSDADAGDTLTWSCTGCTDQGDTQTATGTYGSWSIVEATGAWTYTLNNADTDTDSLDGGDTATDSLTMVVSDGTTTASHQVDVTVNGANDAPTSAAGTGSTDEDTLVTFANSDFSFSDVDGDDTAFSRIQITTLESSGDLECNDANGDDDDWQDCVADDYVTAGTALRFTPASNSDDDVTFSFKVHDGTAYSASAYVFTISVSAANDVPTWSGTAGDITVNEDTAGAITGAVIADVDDTSLDSMTISSTNSGTFTLASTSGLTFATGDGTDDNQMVFSGTVANINTAIATITWTSAANDNTNSVLSLTANDGDGDSATDTVAITVNAVNDAPTSSGAAVTVTEDVAYVSWTTEGAWGYSDVESSAMTQIKLASLPSNGVLTDDDEDACGAGTACAVDDVIVLAKLDDLFYTTNSNSVASDSFTFYVHDGTTWSASAATMTITVTPVNDAPTVANAQDDFSTNEDSGLSYQFNTNVFTDVDSGDSCTYTSTLTNGNALPGWLTFTASTRTYSGTPTNDDVGTVNVRTTCTDGSNAAVNDDFVITVVNTNDLPTTAGDTATVTEDVAYAGWTASSDWGYSDVDANDAMVSIKIITLPATGTLLCPDDSACEANDVVALGDLSDLEYTTASNSVTSTSFTFTVNDGDGDSSSAGTMSITVTPVDDQPVAGDTQDSTAYEDVAFSLTTVQSTDVDTGDSLTVTCVETGGDLPAWLSQSDNGDGTATLSGTGAAANLDDADSGSDNTFSMTCSTSDGTGDAVTDTFVITLTEVNDAPVLSSDGAGSVTAGSVNQGAAVSITLTATDEESNDATFSEGASCPDWITVGDGGANDMTGSLTADASDITDARVGDHDCDISISDGTTSALYTYTLTIAEINDEPTLTGTGVTSTFTEGGNNLVLYTAADAADSDSQATQTFLSFVMTVTNVQDTEEYLVIDGSDCDITTAATCVADTAGSSMAVVVSLVGTTATVTVTADAGGISESALESILTSIAYKNTDDSPTTAAQRVATITTLQDNGGSANSNDDSVTVAIAATVTVANTNDAPTVANALVNQAVDEDAALDYTFAANTFADADSGSSCTYTATDTSGNALTWLANIHSK